MRIISLLIMFTVPIFTFAQKAKWYDGQWKGTSIDPNSRPLTETQVEFVSRSQNNTYTMNYSQVPCASTLEWSEDDNKHVYFSEKITSGGCKNDLTVIMERSKKAIIATYYDGMKIKAIAKLKRVSK